MTKTALMCLLIAVATAVAFPVPAEPAFAGDPYPLNVCAVSGEELGSMGDPISFVHQGREVKFCCAGCEPRMKGDPAKYLAEVDKKIIAQQLEYYPLKTDVVSGEPLPADAKVLNIVHNNRLVRLGDQKSAQKFMKDPAPYLAKLDEAVIAAQLASYPLTTCIITGEPLDAMGEPVQKVYANRLVQFCCEGCTKKFLAQPGKYLDALAGGEASELISPEEVHKDDPDHH